MPVQIVRADLNLPVTVINPILAAAKRRSAALSPNPLPANASFIQLRAIDVEESQFPETVISPKGGAVETTADLVAPRGT